MNQERMLYSTQLQAGLGLVDETKTLLGLFESGMTASDLFHKALDSGLFPSMSARRLRNMISEAFAPRFLKSSAAVYLKPIVSKLPNTAISQFCLVYTALANKILLDFIKHVYWPFYAANKDFLASEDARKFVVQAVAEGRTQKIWAETTIRRVSSYLLGCCADFGLLSSTRSANRKIQSLRIDDLVFLYFAYYLHLSGISDHAVINHDVWKLFGMEEADVRESFKRLSCNGWWIIQSAGEFIRITWKYKSMEEVTDVVTQC